jgi:X-Pro dipeptidyl-peptidase
MTPAVPRAGGRRRGRALAVAITTVLAGGLAVAATPAQAAPAPEPAEPTFVDGLSQSVFTRVSTEWINEEAWVESDVDSDRDGKPDLVIDRDGFSAAEPLNLMFLQKT